MGFYTYSLPGYPPVYREMDRFSGEISKGCHRLLGLTRGYPPSSEPKYIPIGHPNFTNLEKVNRSTIDIDYPPVNKHRCAKKIKIHHVYPFADCCPTEIICFSTSNVSFPLAANIPAIQHPHLSTPGSIAWFAKFRPTASLSSSRATAR